MNLVTAGDSPFYRSPYPDYSALAGRQLTPPLLSPALTGAVTVAATSDTGSAITPTRQSIVNVAAERHLQIPNSQPNTFSSIPFSSPFTGRYRPLPGRPRSRSTSPIIARNGTGLIANQEEGISERLKKHTGSLFSWADRTVRRYSSVASQVITFVCDVGLFTTLLDKNAPMEASKGFLTTLDFVGLVPMRFTFHWINKLHKDASFAWRIGYKRVAFIAGIKALEVISNLALMIASSTGAIEGLAGRDAIQNGIYKQLIPLSYPPLVIGFLMNCTYMYLEYQVLKELNALMPTDQTLEDEQQDQVDEIIEAFTDVDNANKSAQKLAALIRLGMDKDTLERFLEKIKEIPHDAIERKVEVLKELQGNIRTQQRINQGGGILLLLLGYIALAAEKSFSPLSIERASINLGMDILFTARGVYEVWQEYGQRAKIDKV